MIRKLLAAVTAAAALALTAPAAQAAPNVPTPQVPAPHVRPAPPVVAPLCVTTTWRAKHTHRPKTRPGRVCRIGDGMWLPDSWLILDVVVVGGEPYLLVQRPRVVHRRDVRAYGTIG